MKLRATLIIPFLVALTTTLVSLAGCARTSTRDTVEARVDALVAAYQRETYAPGASVAVIRVGRDTLVYRGYGLADVENEAAATPLTVYRIGSVTKQFTAAAVLRLVDEKRVELDAPISRYVPRLPDAWSGIRVRHLLNHTAGIPDFRERWLTENLREDALTPDSVIGIVRNEPLEFAPGTRWKYSNIGYILLGLLIERVTGEPYAHHLRTRLFEPLGLAATRYCDVTPLIPHRAEGYEQRDTSVVNARYTSMTAPFSAGGLCSTVGDLAAWNRALATGRVVSAASRAMMTTPDSAAREAGYGFGVWVQTIEGRRVIRHAGGIEGFRADNAYLPDDSLSVTVLTNLAAPGPEELLSEIVRAGLGSPPQPAPGRTR
jgi:D-alanyl-D-alanine carboxypeptidase